MAVDLDSLWEHVVGETRVRPWSVHGPDHWRRVERNGRLISQRSGADELVVRLFALFHDCRRRNESWDPGHGRRGAAYAGTLREAWLADLSDDQFTLLEFACTWHTKRDHHDDPTIGTCWDADRLDLGRVGIVPSAKYMSTAFGKEIADFGSLYPWRDLLPDADFGPAD